ncbi:MAG TPA: hypothetical protein DIC18_00465 [Clostridiales bacterium]|nr:hypothetical protein [Clostridiales bacterium]
MKKCTAFWKIKKGFTLVELIVVMSIMAITTAIVLPNLRGMITQTEFRKVEGYCITANTNVRNYVFQLNLGEEKVPYTYKGDNFYYTISSNSGLTGALNEYNLETSFQYYVLEFNPSLTTNPSNKIQSLIKGGNLSSKDTMVVCITRSSANYYALKGFWYYDYDKQRVVCTYKSSGNQSGMGFYALNKDIT